MENVLFPQIESGKKIAGFVLTIIFLFFVFLGFILLMVAGSVGGIFSINTGFVNAAPVDVHGQIPAKLLPIFYGAQQKYGVSWAVLAAICKIETDFGQDVSTSSAGAIGFMQFEPSTWAEYAVSPVGHNPPDPYDPNDAIYTAARYLAACGFQTDPKRAIWDYNHAEWYVDEVLSLALSYSSDMLPVGNGTWPVPGHTAISSGYGYRMLNGKQEFHDGIDIPAPEGTPVVAATTGKVIMAQYYDGYGLCVQVQSDSCTTLYGHLSGISVSQGNTVTAGQVIGYVGQTGYATGPHLHFGVYVNGRTCDPLQWLKKS